MWKFGNPKILALKNLKNLSIRKCVHLEIFKFTYLLPQNRNDTRFIPLQQLLAKESLRCIREYNITRCYKNYYSLSYFDLSFPSLLYIIVTILKIAFSVSLVQLFDRIRFVAQTINFRGNQRVKPYMSNRTFF